MFYPKLAVTNIRKNRKSYFPYILTCILTIMMFYTMDAICKNKGVYEMRGSDAMIAVLNMASWITGIFAAIFLFYTNSFLIKQRKKEFGVYQVLGMDKRNLMKMLLCETFLTAVVSIGIGLVLGILLGKLFFLILLKMIRFATPLSFAIEGESIVRTLILFGAVFAVTFCFNLLQLRKVDPVDLLHGGNVGEREPKTKWLLTSIGTATIAVGYGIALLTESPLASLENFFFAVILVIIGTYALFTAGSIAFLKLLKRNKNYYYKSNHFATVSGMLYRMKQNAAGLANICIMSTIVLVLISVTVSLYAGMQDILGLRFPMEYHVAVYDPDQERVSQMQQIVEEELEREQAQVEEKEELVSLYLVGTVSGNTVSVSDGMMNLGGTHSIVVTTLDCYNFMEDKNETLAEGEILLCPAKGEMQGNTVTIGDSNFHVKKYLDSIKMETYEDSAVTPNVYVVVSDQNELYKIADKYAFNGQGSIVYHQYFNPKGEKDACTAAMNAIYERGAEIDGTYFEWRENSEEEFYQLYGGFLFIGVFVGFLFLMGTILIIYYKQISEGLDDRACFQIMSKVGMSRKEVKKTIHSQVLTVFFLPLGVAVVHVAVAFKVLTKLMAMLNLTNVPLEAACTVGTVAVFSIFYVIVFLLTSKEYYRIVK
ncbi:ABC transporter permease [Mediterraneibacter agrestimuris]|uniref:ABC transporter permease n=1 Tax=Mediterraneibacter agrestimuris TaxID=2941333 RepID=UPI00204120E2|nr:ABC transporter permease [Mediterraneibacter agrestimuris]